MFVYVIYWFSPIPQEKSPSLTALCEDTTRTTLTCSDFNLRALQPDRRVESLLRFSSPEELDRFNQEARNSNRYGELFGLYPPMDEVQPCLTLNTVLNVKRCSLQNTFDLVKCCLQSALVCPVQEDAVAIRPIPDCPKEHFGQRILVRCQTIK